MLLLPFLIELKQNIDESEGSGGGVSGAEMIRQSRKRAEASGRRRRLSQYQTSQSLFFSLYLSASEQKMAVRSLYNNRTG